MPQQVKQSLIAALVIVSLGVGGVFFMIERPSPKIRVAPDIEIELPDTEPWQENMARGQLLHLHRNCEILWKQEGDMEPCSIEKLTGPGYYFSLHPVDWTKEQGTVEVAIETGYPPNFIAHARHVNSPVKWTINHDEHFKCSLGNAWACNVITHVPREDILREVREYVGDVLDDTDYIDFSTYPPVAGKYGEKGN